MTEWIGRVPAFCQKCGVGRLDQVMFDLNLRGTWGLVCEKCADGHALGTGRGQRYECQASGVWLKTGG